MPFLAALVVQEAFQLLVRMRLLAQVELVLRQAVATVLAAVLVTLNA
jgi:hypothetical protein